MVSTAERTRRYGLLREEMSNSGLEVLVVCGRDDLAGSEQGRLQYVSDLEFVSGRCFAVIPPTAEPTLCMPAHVGRAMAADPGWITDVPVAVNAIDAVIASLQGTDHPFRRIGIVGLADLLSVDDMQSMRAAFPNAEFIDATGGFDRIRSVKSPEELGYIRQTCDVFRRGFAAVEASLAPGLTERMIAAELLRILKLHGCTGGFLNVARSGGTTTFHPPGDDVIRPDDVIGFDLEYRGPTGYAVELTRYFSFAPPPAATLRTFEIQREAFLAGLAAMRPGADFGDVLGVVGSCYRSHGHVLAGPVGWGAVMYQAHGIGLDFMEPPYLVLGAAGQLTPDTVVAFHPRIGPENPNELDITVLDNVLITESGAEPMTYPEPIWTTL